MRRGVDKVWFVRIFRAVLLMIFSISSYASMSLAQPSAEALPRLPDGTYTSLCLPGKDKGNSQPVV